MTKNDFYRNARRRGAPLVPGSDKFPLFVKPANGCASQLIDENSVCHDEEELEFALRRINKAMQDARTRRAVATGIADPAAYVKSYNPIGRNSDDIVVQEYVPGKDYTCTVIQMGTCCIALAPFVYRMKDTVTGEQFLTFDLKFDDETRIELLHKNKNPELYERLQKTAIEAFMASGCEGSNMGCDVDLRATPDGTVFAIEVNPQPAAFLPGGTYEDLPIIHSLPGGHAAVINIFIANHMLRHPSQWSVSSKVAAAYDHMAPKYDVLAEKTKFPLAIASLVDELDFSGTTFDLACGTGIFGRALSARKTRARGDKSSRLIGFDISPGMLDICRNTRVYDAVHVDSI
jgi:hypothetical protein